MASIASSGTEHTVMKRTPVRDPRPVLMAPLCLPCKLGRLARSGLDCCTSCIAFVAVFRWSTSGSLALAIHDLFFAFCLLIPTSHHFLRVQRVDHSRPPATPRCSSAIHTTERYASS